MAQVFNANLCQHVTPFGNQVSSQTDMAARKLGAASVYSSFSRWGLEIQATRSMPGGTVTRPSGSARFAVRAAASERSPRTENVDGDFFVDHTCIDCDTCRWMAPAVFNRQNGMSAVHQQPGDKRQRLEALQALLACPTASIRTREPPKDIGEANASFPLPIDEATLPGVFHCGYHSKKSYGATSYVIRAPGGNILVDSPRFAEPLARHLEEMGGVKYMFLTHRDDVADHDRWHARFGCERIIHDTEVGSSTRGVETKLQGSGPWALGPDADLIFTPGHTEGCVSLLYKPGQALFTGDHLCFSERMDSLSMMRGVNWYSVEKQLESTEKLRDVDFVWLLPGHGRRMKFDSIAQKNGMLDALLEREMEVPAGSRRSW